MPKTVIPASVVPQTPPCLFSRTLLPSSFSLASDGNDIKQERKKEVKFSSRSALLLSAVF